MNIVGDITFVDEIIDGFDAPELNGATRIEHVNIAGVDYLYVSGSADDGLQVLELGADGQITAVQEVPYTASNLLDRPEDLEIVTFGGESYLIVANFDDDALSVFRIDNDNNGTNGHLQLTDTISNADLTGYAGILDGVLALDSVTLNNKAIITAGAYYGDAIGTYEINSNGEITFLDAVYDTDATAHELNGVHDLEYLEVDGTQYAFVASYEDQGLSVFELNTNNGNLTNVDNYQGGRQYTSVAPLDYNGENLLIAAGSGVIDIFAIGDDGALTFLAATNDEDAGIYYPEYFDAIEIEGVPFLLASDYYDGIALFSINESYQLEQVSSIPGTSYDNAAESITVQIGNSLYVVTAAYDTDRVTVSEIDGTDQYLVGTEEADRIVGLAGDDDLLGRQGHDEIQGGIGDDVISGNNGKDTLIGDAGDDVLIGGNGNDEIIGGAGADIMKGSSGIDWLSYETSASAVTIDLETGLGSGGDAEGDYFREFENLRGSSGGDDLTGDSTDNRIEGLNGKDDIDTGAGNDTAKGGNGNDTISGAAGDDQLDGQNGHDDVSGGAGDDTITGGKGDDTLHGGSGDDEIEGGAQNDLLIGAKGNDTMTGNAGTDTFEFSGDFGNDEIMDFDTGNGGDILDFSTIGEINSLSDFKTAAISFGDTTVVTFSDPDLSITLYGTHENDFTNSNFLF